MTPFEIFSHMAVFAAAFLQSATGVGFALVAGPVILILIDGHAAVQITMMLSLTVCAVLAPTLVSQVDRAMLKRLLIGTAVGLPAGLVVFWLADLPTLKILAMLCVAFMAWSVARAPSNLAKARAQRPVSDLAIGVLSGAMNTALAMPGPAPAARMTALAMPKLTVRATVLLLMVASYSAALAVQAAFVGVEVASLATAAWFLPATLVGILGGRLVVSRIDEAAFRRIIAIVLILTAIGLLIDVGGERFASTYLGFNASG